MYTYCKIQFLDEDEPWDVIIKSNDEFDPSDEDIFFYGLTRAELIAMWKSGTVLEGEWKIVEIGETVNEID